MNVKVKKGQASMREIPTSALYLGIAVIVVALIIAVLAGLETSVCTQNSGTVGAFNSSPFVGTANTDPVGGDYTGCCSLINTSFNRSNVCETWVAAAGINATNAGITGLGTFNDFWSVLVLIVILSVVIVSLYAVFPRRAGI